MNKQLVKEKRFSLFLLGLVLTLGLVQGLSVAAWAQTVEVYNNFGPGGSYSKSGGWPEFGPAAGGPPTWKVIAEAFAVSAPTPVKLTAVTMALSYGLGHNAINVFLCADGGGFPDCPPGINGTGKPLVSWLKVKMPAKAGTCCKVIKLKAPTKSPVILTPGSVYWLVPVVAYDDTLAFWNWNVIGDTGDYAVYAPLYYGEAWMPTLGLIDGAFKVVGSEE